MVKKIYTWGGKFADRNYTVDDLIKSKGKKKTNSNDCNKYRRG